MEQGLPSGERKARLRVLVNGASAPQTNLSLTIDVLSYVGKKKKKRKKNQSRVSKVKLDFCQKPAIQTIGS